VVEDAKVMARGGKHLPVMTDQTSSSPKSNEGKLKKEAMPSGARRRVTFHGGPLH